MKAARVRFHPAARADLADLYDFIADRAGAAVAFAYIGRIDAACLKLATFPLRGTRRDDLLPGLRTVGFERRATIAFRATEADVEIIGIFYGGRDVDAAFNDR